MFKQCLLYELYHTERKTENYSQMCVCEREREKKERKKDRRRVFLIGLSRWESLRSDAQDDKKQTWKIEELQASVSFTRMSKLQKSTLHISLLSGVGLF